MDVQSNCVDTQEIYATTAISDEFVKEEEEILKENLLEQKVLLDDEQEKRKLQLESKEEKRKRLMLLLNKSEFYSSFLSQRLYRNDFNAEIDKSGENKENADGNRTTKPNANIKKGNKDSKGASSRGKPGNVDNEKSSSAIKELSQEKQPKLFENGTMRPYQLDGFTWLKAMFENGMNGILADEMGLGKTIQCIALFCHLINFGISGPFLVVAPLSTLSNWILEFKRFAPKIPTLLYHGSKETRKMKAEQILTTSHISGCSTDVMPVVITSYEVVIKDVKLLSMHKWRYVVVDEGHRLKNFQCRLTITLRKFSADNRLLLTGTPLQNNLAELWSLLNFILPEIFDSLDIFQSWFVIEDMMEKDSNAKIVEQEKQDQIISTLHKILNPFLLRRTKMEVDLSIPPKRELLVYVPMTDTQLELYTATINKNFDKVLALLNPVEESPIECSSLGRPKRNATLNPVSYAALFEDSESDAALDNYLNLFVTNEKSATKKKKRTAKLNVKFQNIMMLSRKIVNHPYLIKYPLTEEEEYKIDEDLVNTCGKLRVLDQLLTELRKRGHKILLFSQMTKMLDIIEDYLSLRPQFTYKRLDGSVQLSQRTADIEAFNNNDAYNIFLLSTRAGGLGINLTAADTVIIYDSDWNPQQDLQAQDRCHRIGQTRSVLILRLVASSTVDQRIVERAASKRKLERMIITSGQFTTNHKNFGREDTVTPENLLHLLEQRDHEKIHQVTHGNVFSMGELSEILDRTGGSTHAEVEGTSSNFAVIH